MVSYCNIQLKICWVSLCHFHSCVSQLSLTTPKNSHSKPCILLIPQLRNEHFTYWCKLRLCIQVVSCSSVTSNGQVLPGFTSPSCLLMLLLYTKRKVFSKASLTSLSPQLSAPVWKKKKSDNKKVSALEKRNGTLVIKEEQRCHWEMDWSPDSVKSISESSFTVSAITHSLSFSRMLY